MARAYPKRSDTGRFPELAGVGRLAADLFRLGQTPEAADFNRLSPISTSDPAGGLARAVGDQ